MPDLPAYITQARITKVAARTVTVELTVDPAALRDERKQQAVYAWADDPANAGLLLTQLTCPACGAIVLLAGHTTPVRWVCECGQEQAGPDAPDPRSASPRERLTAYAHDAWSEWMVYMFSKSAINADGSVTLPPRYATALRRLMTTPYSALSETERNLDRAEADKMLAIVNAGSP